MRTRTLPIVAFLAFAACGGSSDDPQGDCYRLANATCNRWADCQVAKGASRDSAYGECSREVAARVDCSQATGTNSNYGACMEVLPTYDCTLLLTTGTPEQCKHALTK